MHIEEHNHCFMHYFGVKTLSETLFPPPLMKAGYGARFSCTLGEKCRILLDGVGLARSNALVILASGDCGSKAGVLADWTPFSFYGVAVDATEPYSSYGFGTPLDGHVGSHYKLCWAHDPLLGPGSFRTTKPRNPQHLDAIGGGRKRVPGVFMHKNSV